MTLILNNDDIASVLTMDETISALEGAYQELARQEAVCGPRVNIRIPTADPEKTYQWGIMDGGSVSGYFAIRMKSDIVYEEGSGDTRTREKYCVRPGLFCGLIFLFDIQNGEPLALINDGYLQHMRVGADSGIGAKYMARENAKVVGMIGSGGMARTHAEAFAAVRDIERIQVYSPSKEHRETYAAEITQRLGIKTVAMDNPADVYRGADIVAGCTDATVPVVLGKWIEDGTHITSVGGPPDGEALERIDRSLRLGSAPAPVGLPEFALHDESVSYEALGRGGRPPLPNSRSGRRSHGVIAQDRAVFFKELLSGEKQGRPSQAAVTYSERGNIQGVQFFAVAGRAYELAKAKGLGHELPTEWLLQDIRD